VEQILFKLFPQSFVRMKTFQTTQPTDVALIMNVPPTMALVPTNVLCIQSPTYHDNDDPILHLTND
jgi:hypothetical protein